jgi:hypothetical protein
MNIGGPQGINVKRILTQDWMSVPVMNDTPIAPLTGAGWPGKGYLIFVTKPDTCIAGNDCPPKDTSLWEYTGNRWKRVGMDYLTKLVFGGDVTQNGSFARQHIVSSYGAFINGAYYRQPSAIAVTADVKAADSTSRIDVIVITRAGPVIKKGQARVVPFKPTVSGEEIELSTIYFRAFDTVPRFIASTATGVTNLFRVPGKDSIFFSIDTVTLAIKDSVGISTATNGLTYLDKNVKLGGSLIENTNINLSSRRLSIIGGSDTTRFFSNGSLSLGSTPSDSTYRFNVNGGAKVDSIIVDSLYAKFGRYLGDGSAPFAPIEFRATSGNRARIDLRPASNGGWNSNWYGAITHNGPETDIFAANYGSLYLGNSFWTAGGGIYLGNTRNSPSMYIRNNNNVLIGDTANTGYRLDVNGTTRVRGVLYLQPQTPSTSAIIINQNSNDGNIVWGGSDLSLNASIGARNTIISPSGTFSNLTGTSNTVIGRNVSSLTSGANNVLLGTNAGSSLTTGSNNTIIGFGDGHNYPSNTANSIHIVAGGGYEQNRGDTVLLGLSSGYALIGGGFGTGSYVSDFYFGAGHRVRLPNLTHVNFYAPSGFPTKADTIGSNFTINAGRGTGQGIGGSVIFRTSDTTATGTTLQTLTERVRITPRGNMLVGTSADSLFRLDVNGRVRLRDTLTLSTTPVTADTSANDLLVINSSNGQVRRYTGNWYSVPLTGSATLDFPSTGHGNSADLTFTLTGAAEGDVVALGIPNASIVANGSFIAWVSATDTITVRFNNYASSGSSNPASGTFKIKVFK